MPSLALLGAFVLSMSCPRAVADNTAREPTHAIVIKNFDFCLTLICLNLPFRTMARCRGCWSRQDSFTQEGAVIPVPSESQAVISPGSVADCPADAHVHRGAI